VDAARFDALLRTLSETISRRTVARASAGLSLAGILATQLGLPMAEGKKQHKKKKKKCKGGTKKCGKKCIPADDCCTNADCATGGACAGGLCICPDGQKDCFGQCVDDETCCLECGEDCCLTESAESEVCNPNSGDPVCQSGGCPETDYCNVPEAFFCATAPNICACATTVDDPPVNACVSVEGLEADTCDPCSVSSQCDNGEVCIPGGTVGCGCDSSFCVPLCNP
jgi:hypothetical protein